MQPHEVETWTSGGKGGGCSTVKEEGEDRHVVYGTAATRRGVLGELGWCISEKIGGRREKKGGNVRK